MTRTKDEYEHALSLSQSGLTAAAVARRTGIPRRTIHDWRVGLVPSAFAALACGCKEHVFDALPSSAYVYLLGLYLGDGYLARHPRKVRRLRVSLDAKYPGIIAEAVEAMRAVMPGRTASVQRIGGHVEVYSYARRWACLLPQDGPGLKHERDIVLRRWQRAHIERDPRYFLRGLIHSDGCRSINTGRNGWRSPRYSFSNVSTDILSIFTWTCDLLDLRWTTAPHTVYVSRKADVARMDEFIGPKR